MPPRKAMVEMKQQFTAGELDMQFVLCSLAVRLPPKHQVPLALQPVVESFERLATLVHGLAASEGGTLSALQTTCAARLEECAAVVSEAPSRIRANIKGRDAQEAALLAVIVNKRALHHARAQLGLLADSVAHIKHPFQGHHDECEGGEQGWAFWIDAPRIEPRQAEMALPAAERMFFTGIACFDSKFEATREVLLELTTTNNALVTSIQRFRESFLYTILGVHN